MSRHDLKELGEHLDTGQAGLVVVGVTDMEAKIEKEMRRAEKIQKKQLQADVEAIERDAVSVTSGVCAPRVHRGTESASSAATDRTGR
jgi:hypothetical protein